MLPHDFVHIDCVQFVGDLILSKSVSNKVVLWKPLFNDKESENAIHIKHRVPSSILFLREFTLDHCGSWYVRFESPPPYHQILALGNQKGDVKIWRIGENADDDSGCHPNQSHFCRLKTSEYFNGGYDQSTVRMVAFNPHGNHLVAVKDDSTVWVWNPEF